MNISRLLEKVQGESTCDIETSTTTEDFNQAEDEVNVDADKTANSRSNQTFDGALANTCKSENWNKNDLHSHNVCDSHSLIEESSPYEKIKRSSWSTPEKYHARYLFQDNITNKTLPNLAECDHATMTCKALKNRCGPVLKAWISNQIKAKTRSDAGKSVRTWHTPERQAVRLLFKTHFEQQTLPSEEECWRKARKCKTLEGRSAIQVKLFVHNEINRQKKYVRKVF